jgi:putative nucleotidyltransferase with HDIG domain
MIAAMCRPCAGYDLGENELWNHSVAAALAAERLSRYAMRPIPGAAFTAALVHDVGKLVLDRHLDAATADRIWRLTREESLAYVDAERRVLGTDHAEIGGQIARHWNFPEALVQAIERHHDPDPVNDPILDAVHIANAVARLVGVGLGSEQMSMVASTAAAERLGLTATRLEGLCATVGAELAEADSIWRGG